MQGCEKGKTTYEIGKCFSFGQIKNWQQKLLKQKQQLMSVS